MAINKGAPIAHKTKKEWPYLMANYLKTTKKIGLWLLVTGLY